jgi:hypothetical protein
MDLTEIGRTGSIWLRIETDGGILWMRWWTSGFHKLREMCWVASQEGLGVARGDDFPTQMPIKKLTYTITRNTIQSYMKTFRKAGEHVRVISVVLSIMSSYISVTSRRTSKAAEKKRVQLYNKMAWLRTFSSRHVRCWFSALVTTWREGCVGEIYIERSTWEITGTTAHSNIHWWKREVVQYDSVTGTMLHSNKSQRLVQYWETECGRNICFTTTTRKCIRTLYSR